MTDKRRLLKIKLKSLTAEAKIIRMEEEKLKHSKRPENTELLAEMQQHRRKELREEARMTLLAYSFIRGRRYRQIEPRSDLRSFPDPFKSGHLKHASLLAPYYSPWPERVDRIKEMGAKYGGKSFTVLEIREWLMAEADAPKAVKAPKKPYIGPGKPAAA